MGHSLLAADAAQAKPLNPLQRLIFSAATRDATTAARVEAFAARTARASSLFSPRTLGRAALVNARRC
jgi:hypothetical protein